MMKLIVCLPAAFDKANSGFTQNERLQLYLMLKAIKILGLLAAVIVLVMGAETAEGEKDGELAFLEDVSILR